MLILDSHVTHTKNLAVTEMARKLERSCFTSATHDSSTQAFGWGCFGPFGEYYDDALRMWLREHVGRPVTTWQVARMLLVTSGRQVCGH